MTPFPFQQAIRLKKRKEKTAYTSLNTPMLIAILRKSYKEEPSGE
jgi:mannose/fructose-specific phosphotransferase system component IIA